MSPGRYRHSRTLDIDMEVISSYPTVCGYSVKAMIYNRYNGVVYQIKTFNINKDQLKYWSKL